MKRLVVLATVCAVFIGASYAAAWDGQRKGFILGGGVGLSPTTWDQEVEILGVTLGMDPETALAFDTDFRIGYAPTNQLSLYYFSKDAWFIMENILNDEVIIESGVFGLGGTYYLSPEPGTFLFNLGVGGAVWDAPFEDSGDPWFGFGFIAGAGYEFAKHWSGEVNFTWGETRDSESDIDVVTDAFSFMFTINVTGY